LKILLVGGTGCLGRGLVKNLKLKSYNVIVWDKDQGMHNLSVLNLEDYGIDLIINLSVIANLKQKEVRIKDSDYLVNVIGLAHLVELSEITSIPLVHISTREVIGIRNFQLNSSNKLHTTVLREINETEPYMPTHSYGKTKLIGEFIMQGCTKGSVIRLNTCYTDEIQGGSGLIANLIRKSRQDSRVVLDNNGIAIRDPLHVNDLSSLILTVHSAQSYGEIFHAGGGSENILSLREICELSNSKVQIESGKINDDFGFIMDIRKALDLGWEPKIKFREWIKTHYE